MMINYGIFFTLESTVVRLPINPEELPDVLEGNNETYNILGVGEVTSPRTPLQRTISFSGLFPARAESYVLTPNQFWTPEKYINFFRGAMNDKSTLIYTPVRYMEDGTPFATSDVGFRCTVESFTVTERGGETGDFYYELIIKEWRDYSAQEVKATINVPSVIASNIATSTTTITQTPTRPTDAGVVARGSQVQVNGTVTANPDGTGAKMNVSVNAEVRRKAESVAQDTAKEMTYLVKTALGLNGSSTNSAASNSVVNTTTYLNANPNMRYMAYSWAKRSSIKTIQGSL